MGKLEKLSIEQEKIMIETRDYWIDLALNQNKKGIDKAKFEKGINWLYTNLLKKDVPKIVYCDSCFSCLIVIDIFKKLKKDSVWDSVGGSVGASVRVSVWDSVWDSVWASVFSEHSYYVGFIDYGWVSFYDFFTKIGIINNDKFNKYKELTEANCFQTYCYENYVFAIQPPLEIIKNENGQLHNINKASVEFSDKTKYYFVNGRNIPESTFIKLKEDKYTIEDFIKEQNEEIKSASIAYLQEVKGDDFLVTFFKENLKEIDTFVDKKDEKYLKGTTNGMNVGVYTLFKGEINNTNIAYVRCYCPSTDRMFFLGVSSEYNNAKDAIASLYRIPKKLKPYIQEINRQGERFSTCLTQEGKYLVKTLPKKDIEDLISITGDEYFSKIKYEY